MLNEQISGTNVQALASRSTVFIQMARHRFTGHQSRWPIP